VPTSSSRRTRRRIDEIPNNPRSHILLEHRWAIPLRCRGAGERHADRGLFIHPLDLVAIGLIAAEEAEAPRRQSSKKEKRPEHERKEPMFDQVAEWHRTSGAPTPHDGPQRADVRRAGAVLRATGAHCPGSSGARYDRAAPDLAKLHEQESSREEFAAKKKEIPI
jgi:hypothetical protein